MSGSVFVLPILFAIRIYVIEKRYNATKLKGVPLPGNTARTASAGRAAKPRPRVGVRSPARAGTVDRRRTVPLRSPGPPGGTRRPRLGPCPSPQRARPRGAGPGAVTCPSDSPSTGSRVVVVPTVSAMPSGANTSSASYSSKGRPATRSMMRAAVQWLALL